MVTETLRSWMRMLTTNDRLIEVLVVLGRLFLILLFVYASYVVLRRLAGAMFERMERKAEGGARKRVALLRRFVQQLLRFGMLAALIIATLAALGVQVGQWLANGWLRDALYAVLIVIGAHGVIRLGTVIIDEIFERGNELGDELDAHLLEKERAETLRSLLKNVLRYGVDVAAIMLVLSQIGIDTTALLASVGLASLAIGFGAQSLVRDLISGFFILFEDQYRVGDYIETAGLSGYVVEVGLRVTKLRDFGGQIHIIPNGEVTKVSNYSRGAMTVMFDVRVAYEADVEKAMAVIERACVAYAASDPRVVTVPSVLGIHQLSESSVDIRIWGEAEPMAQWSVSRGLRLAIKKALDEAGIEIPYPRQVLVPAASTSARPPRAPRPVHGGQAEGEAEPGGASP